MLAWSPLALCHQWLGGPHALVVENGDEERLTETPPPLTSKLFTADPSAHLWPHQRRLYIYCSHDSPTVIEGLEVPHFNMEDYHVLSLGLDDEEAVVHEVALRLADIPWASSKLWAPDAAFHNGTYYLYFPAMDKRGIFRIGVARSSQPEGPFVPEPQPIPGSYSIDPAVYRDEDGAHYVFFGGIWGGQLQRWERQGDFDASPECTRDGKRNDDEPAIPPRYARLSDDMLSFAHPPQRVRIVDESGAPLLAGDHERRYFEGPFVHRRGTTYYLSWSTGDTHRIVYATAESVHGPFTFRGVVSYPVHGWTHHHSIVEVGDDQWLFFFHDTQRSGLTHLRDVKVRPLAHRADGSIEALHHTYGGVEVVSS